MLTPRTSPAVRFHGATERLSPGAERPAGEGSGELPPADAVPDAIRRTPSTSASRSFLKKCNDCALIYRDYDAMPWRPGCPAGLNQMEITEGGEMKLLPCLQTILDSYKAEFYGLHPACTTSGSACPHLTYCGNARAAAGSSRVVAGKPIRPRAEEPVGHLRPCDEAACPMGFRWPPKPKVAGSNPVGEISLPPSLMSSSITARGRQAVFGLCRS
jgi:hypothetical protein